MGCMYATGPLSKCLCACKGSLHGLMVKTTQPAVCSPSVTKRCMAGQEGGECQCACGGANHGLYGAIEDFGAIPVYGLV